MSEKNKREQTNHSSPEEQNFKTSATHEAPVDQPQVHEKEQRDKDLENLHRAAAEKANIIADKLISKNSLKLYPSEIENYKDNLTQKLERILKQAYEAGKSDSVDVEINEFIDDAITENEREKKWQERIATSTADGMRRKNLEAELKLLENKDEPSEQEQLKHDELDKLEKEHLENTEYCKQRWNKLSAEDQQSIKDNIEESIKITRANENLSAVEKRAARAELIRSLAVEWGSDLATELFTSAKDRVRLSGQPSTADVEKVKEEEENNPVRVRGMKRFLQSVTGKARGARNKVELAMRMNPGSPVSFVRDVLKRESKVGEDIDSKAHEENDSKRRKIILTIGGVAATAAVAYAGARYAGIIDSDSISQYFGDLNNGGADPIESSPDVNPDRWQSIEGYEDNREVPGNNKWPEESTSSDLEQPWSGEFTPADPEQPWFGHNYFDHGYSLENSPFTAEGKNGAFDYGPPLDLSENFNESLLDRIDSEPAMHIDYIKEYDLEGSNLSDGEIRERLMNDREYFESTLEDIRHRITSSESEIITLDPGTYGSTYHYENGGIVESAYDPSVDSEGATAVRKRFVDENGVEYITTIKSECGGQLVVEHTPYTAHAVPAGEYTPPTYYPEQTNNPIGSSEPPVPVITEQPPVPGIIEQPPEEVPTPEETPIPEPTPGPTPEETPIPEPTPGPTPEETPIPEPTPGPTPEETPIPEPTPGPTPDYAPKDNSTEGYVDLGETPTAENNEPSLTPSQEGPTPQDIRDTDVQNFDAPGVDSGVGVDSDTAKDQSVRGNQAPTSGGPGQEVPLY